MLTSLLPRQRRAKKIRASWAIAGDSKSRTDWQRRLWWTGIDRKARDHIVALDNALTDLHDAVGADLEQVLTDLHEEKGYLTGEDITRALDLAMTTVLDEGEGTFREGFEGLSLRGVDQAIERAGINTVTAATNRLIQFSRLRVQADDMGDRIRQNYQDALNRIKSLPADVVEDIRAKLMASPMTGASTREVLRAVIGDLIEQIDPEGVLHPEAVRAAVREVWERTRVDLQRVIRTESINAFSRAQLEEWYAQGIRQVTRHSINDPKTCPKCRELSRPGHNVYDIERLLALEHPVTEDPDNPGAFLTHPNCRCWFRPILQDVWGELEALERDLFADIEGKSVTVENVPLDLQEPVTEMVKDWNKNAPDVAADFAMIEDITKDPDWQRFRLEELMAEDPATAEQILDQEIADGVVIEWVDPETGTTYMTPDIADVQYMTLPLARRQGEIRWEDGGEELHRWWKERYDAKMAETQMTLEENGVEIIGGLPFFVQSAGESARNYFTEAYAHYIVDPTLLFAIDRIAYDRLRDNVFAGTEYLSRGGVK